MTIRRNSTTKRIVVCASYTRSIIAFRGELIQRLASLGYEVFVLAPEYDERTISELAKLSVSFIRYPLSRTSIGLVSDIRSIWSLIRVFREVKPDLVLSYTIKPVIYASIAAKIARVPRIVSLVTGLGYAFSADRTIHQMVAAIVARSLLRLSLKVNEHVFFQNPDDEQLFQRSRILGNEVSSSVTPGSGVSLTKFRYSVPPTSDLSFLLIARLIHAKGIFEYVNAARAVRASNPEVSFKLLGPLDSNPTAFRKGDVQAWHNEGVIEYLGETDDVRPYLENSSVFVLPVKHREGCPRSILEAMAIGRAIVTTDVPGCRETVQNGLNGFLVPPDNEAALVTALLHFVKQPESIQKMGLQSRRLVEEKFDSLEVNKQILSTLHLNG